MVILAYAKALEVIPRQLAHNAGLDSVDVINKLRQNVIIKLDIIQ